MKKLFLVLLTLGLLAGAAPAFAQGNLQGPPPGITSFQGFIDVFDRIIQWLFIVLMILAVIFIILAAFSYLTAGGEEEKVKSAHQKIIYAVVAIAVAFLARGVQYVVSELLFGTNQIPQ
jgi:hypothetical protein